VITSLLVNDGDTVEAGAQLCTIEVGGNSVFSLNRVQQTIPI